MRNVLLSFRFLSISLVGSLTMALVATFAPLPGQIALLGATVSILAGLFVAYMSQEADREQARNDVLRQLRTPVSLAHDSQLYARYCELCESLEMLAARGNPVLRELALLKLSGICDDAGSLARGDVVFTATETWRTAYEQILRNPSLECYRSVAWVRTKDYWQDRPGKQSMLVNYDLIASGLKIERILILSDHLWPPDSAIPSEDILPWINEQHDRGVWLALVRQSEIANEPDLLCDCGIYEGVATGIQELDANAKTTRFLLSFDEASITLAKARWGRLSLYTTSYADLLDHKSQ